MTFTTSKLQQKKSAILLSKYGAWTTRPTRSAYGSEKSGLPDACLPWDTVRGMRKKSLSAIMIIASPFVFTATDTKSWKLSSRPFFLIDFSIRWWNESADIKVCPGSKYLMIMVQKFPACLLTSATNAVYRNQFFPWAEQFSSHNTGVNIFLASYKGNESTCYIFRISSAYAFMP